MTPEDILADFSEAQNQFAPIDRQPTDDDLVRLEETLYPLLLAIPYDSEHGKHNLSGIILDDKTYKTTYGTPFPVPTKPGAYDTSIPDDAKSVIRARAEAIHKARIQDYLIYDAALRATHRFILNVIDDTYVRTLKHATTYYTKVHPRTILKHLRTTCGGLHPIDAVSLINDMNHYYEATTGIPEYINKLEDAQKKAQRANVPIADSTLVAIATASVMASQQYPRTDDVWDDLSPKERTWTKWKTTYTQAYNKALIRKKSTAGTPQFGSAQLTPIVHDSSQHSPHQRHNTEDEYSNTLVHPHTAPPPYDHSASVATPTSNVLDTLVHTNEQLTKTNAELTATVAKLNTQNHQLQRQINAANNRLSQPGISRQRSHNANRTRFNDRTTNKFNDPKDNDRSSTHNSE